MATHAMNDLAAHAFELVNKELASTLDAAMLGVGGLMGIRIATSVLLGALVNFAVLAPIMIQRGEIRSVRIGRAVRVTREALDDFKAGREAAVRAR